MDYVFKSSCSILLLFLVFKSALSTTSIDCIEEQTSGYFRGRSATCICNVTNPQETPQWYDGDGNKITTNLDGSTTFNYDSNNPVAEYFCKAAYDIGGSNGVSLVTQFAFLDDNSVEVSLSSATFNLCPDSNNVDITVTCRVPKTSASPDLKMSYSPYDGVTFTDPEQAVEVGDYYQVQYMFVPDEGGSYQVMCRAQNSIFADIQTESEPSPLTVYEPPGNASPRLAFYFENHNHGYQGIFSTYSPRTLVEGFNGDIRCQGVSGHPEVFDTRLECGPLVATGVADLCVLSFLSDPLTRDLDEVMCSCRVQHISGCYDRVSSVYLNVQYKPGATLTPSKTEINEGQSATLTCRSTGNPSPSVTVTRSRTGEILKTQTSNTSKAVSAEVALTDLDCLDIGSYVCTSTNELGTNTSNIELFIKCIPHLNDTTSETPVYYASVGDSKTFTVDIYSYPEPSVIALTSLVNGRFQSAPIRHTVTYISSTIPFGKLEIALPYLILEDFTAYVIEVTNDVGIMAYAFEIQQELTTTPPPPTTTTTTTEAVETESEEGNSSNANLVLIIGLGVGGMIVVILLIAGLVYFIRKHRKLAKDPATSSSDLGTSETVYHQPYDLHPVYSVPDVQQGGFHSYRRARDNSADQSAPANGSGYLYPVMRVAEGEYNNIPRYVNGSCIANT